MSDQLTKGIKDIRAYLEESTKLITDSELRNECNRAGRDICNPLIDYFEQSYKRLESDMKEMDEQRHQPIITGICKAEDQKMYEDHGMYPLFIKQENQDSVMSVFMKLDYLQIQKLCNSHRTFIAIQETEKGQKECIVSLKKNESYKEVLRSFYEIKIRNGRRWETICAPYLSKFMDVVIEKGRAKEPCSKLTIHFEEYTPYVEYDVVPIWNVRSIRSKSCAKPSLAVDQIHYMHIIYENRLNEENEYLVKEQDCNLWNIKRLRGDLLIYCDRDQEKIWDMYEIVSPVGEIPDTFSNKRVHQSCMWIRTRGEINQFFHAIGADSYFSSIEVLSDCNKEGESYFCDSFLHDELCKKGTSPLVILFTPKIPGYYLNRDLMSYALTCLDWQLGAYQPIGILKE